MFDFKTEIRDLYQKTVKDSDRAWEIAETKRRDDDVEKILQQIQEGDVFGVLRKTIEDPDFWLDNPSVTVVLMSHDDGDILVKVMNVLKSQKGNDWCVIEVLSSDSLDYTVVPLNPHVLPGGYDFALVATFKLS